MKIKILQSDNCYTEVEAAPLTKHFFLHDTFYGGKRNFKIDHIATGRTICRRTFATPEVAASLCNMFEIAFGDLLDTSVNGFLKQDVQKHGNPKKLLALGTSILLEEFEEPINFTKLAKAKKQATKDLGIKYASKLK